MKIVKNKPIPPKMWWGKWMKVAMEMEDGDCCEGLKQHEAMGITRAIQKLGFKATWRKEVGVGICVWKTVKK